MVKDNNRICRSRAVRADRSGGDTHLAMNLIRRVLWQDLKGTHSAR